MATDPSTGDVSRITVLGTLQRAAWQRKTLPPVERLRGGIWSVPVPIPDNPLRYTLSYLVPSGDGLVVVDPGWDAEEGRQALLGGLEHAGASVGDITGIVATHVHPDHHGLSARLREESGAWIAMHPAERDTLPQRLAASQREHRDGTADWLRVLGAAETDIAQLLGTLGSESDPRGKAMAEPDVLLDDGDLVPVEGRTLRAVWTPGHTPGHLCLQEPDARVLLTGDHVLPRITPNIGMHPASTDAPLRRFLESLDRTAGYDDHDALPAHEYRFRGIAARARQLHLHHAQRCAEILDVVDGLGEPTLWQVAEQLTWSRPWADIGMMRFGAIAETTAHLDYLVGLGDIAWLRPDRTTTTLRVRRSRAEDSTYRSAR